MLWKKVKRMYGLPRFLSEWQLQELDTERPFERWLQKEKYLPGLKSMCTGEKTSKRNRTRQKKHDVFLYVEGNN